FGSISTVRTQHVVATAKPAFASIKDVKNDQGKQLFVRFTASPYDYLGSGIPITSYLLYRKLPPGAQALAARPAPFEAVRAASLRADPPDLMLAGWVDVATVTTTTDPEYN